MSPPWNAQLRCAKTINRLKLFLQSGTGKIKPERPKPGSYKGVVLLIAHNTVVVHRPISEAINVLAGVFFHFMAPSEAETDFEKRATIATNKPMA